MLAVDPLNATIICLSVSDSATMTPQSSYSNIKLQSLRINSTIYKKKVKVERIKSVANQFGYFVIKIGQYFAPNSGKIEASWKAFQGIV